MSLKENPNSIRRETITTTTTRKLFGQTLSETTVKREVEYVNLEEDDFKKKVKKVIEKSPRVPPEQRGLVEGLISKVYGDVSTYWGDSAGDVTLIAQRAGFRQDADEPMHTIGQTLLEKGISKATILKISNETFTSSDGMRNQEFQNFLGNIVDINMRVRDEKAS